MSLFKENTTCEVAIPSSNARLDGLLTIPDEARGLVLFVHGSGSSRLSVRNQFVAKVLNRAHLATLLFDLLTPEEETFDNLSGQLRFDVAFLASRLRDATQWCLQQKQLLPLPLGYFGASTGAAAALIAAARLTQEIKAVVSRGGRPDLAKEFLTQVQAPTLLIVGGQDEVVIGMNEEAMAQLACVNRMEIVPGATHLFEEPGTLEEAADLAKNWFVRFLN